MCGDGHGEHNWFDRVEPGLLGRRSGARRAPVSLELSGADNTAAYPGDYVVRIRSYPPARRPIDPSELSVKVELKLMSAGFEFLESSVDLVSLRSQYNVPVWDGESGEHSNAWAKQLVTTLESNNIGWSWWTLKKVHGKAGKGQNTTKPYEIPEPAHYGEILNYVKTFGAGKAPSQGDASKIFLGLAANSATSKCTFNPELIQALFGK